MISSSVLFSLRLVVCLEDQGHFCAVVVIAVYTLNVVVIFTHLCVLFVRRKSKQALRDYKKVQIQLENLETSVRDRCKKEFTGGQRLLCLTCQSHTMLKLANSHKVYIHENSDL